MKRKERNFPHCCWHNQKINSAFFLARFLFAAKFFGFKCSEFDCKFSIRIVLKMQKKNLFWMKISHWAWAKTYTNVKRRNSSTKNCCYTSIKLSRAVAVVEKQQTSIFRFHLAKVKNWRRKVFLKREIVCWPSSIFLFAFRSGKLPHKSENAKTRREIQPQKCILMSATRQLFPVDSFLILDFLFARNIFHRRSFAWCFMNETMKNYAPHTKQQEESRVA